jgi:demethylmenaquinone methyltransferase / 2-methoxy-6-polyprenyl-1,4-benzoquinol methylase
VLDKSSSRIRRMFASIAWRYDRANRLLSLRSDVSWRKRVARELLSSPGLVLDVAAGTGDLAIDLTRFGGHRVVAADFTFEMLVAGQSKMRARSPSSLSVNGDALALPFAPAVFDGVTVAFGIRNFTDPLEGLREMRRVLRPGGRAGILEFSKPRPLINLFYEPYMKHLLPLLGGIVSGSRGPYQYLADSISSFPHGDAFLELMEAAGFERLEAYPLSGGIATFYRGEKS